MKQKWETNAKLPASYDEGALWVLAVEFSFNDKGKSEKKIRRKLRDKKLGEYSQNRIDLLRKFKDAVQNEVNQFAKSKYYTRIPSRFNPDGNYYAHMDDFDRFRMAKDFPKKFPTIPKTVIKWFVDSGVFLYYVK